MPFDLRKGLADLVSFNSALAAFDDWRSALHFLDTFPRHGRCPVGFLLGPESEAVLFGGCFLRGILKGCCFCFLPFGDCVPKGNSCRRCFHGPSVGPLLATGRITIPVVPMRASFVFPMKFNPKSAPCFI